MFPRLALLVLITLMLSSSPPVDAAPMFGAGVVTITLGPGRDGSQTGTAMLTAKGGQTEVMINIQPGAAGVAQPAHIHVGGCPGVGAVVYPLTFPVDGKSTSLVNASLGSLLGGGHSINVHESAARSAIYTSCGNLVLANMPSVTIEMGAGRDASQPGSATLTAKGAQTEITLNIQPGPAGIQQPAHVHEGGCPGVGAVKYPLTNVVNGMSTTTVNAPLSELFNGMFSINAHRSPAEIGIYTSCGNLTLTGAATTPMAPPAPAPAGAITIKRSVHPQVGTYLTDAAGRTLYVFLNDGLRTSTCVGNCPNAWPPIAAAVAGEGASANRIATFTRPDGSTQVAYNGWPLYYFRNDPNPGDISGHGRNALGGWWFAVSPYSGPRFVQAIVTTTQVPGLGTVLADPSGRPLYLATNDEPNKTNCFGSLAERWPPLLTAAPPAAGGAARSDLLGTIRREDGSTQVTYNGWPLYYFNNDVTAGTFAGQGITDGCGAWWVLSAAGQGVQTRLPALMPATGNAGLAAEASGDPMAAGAALLAGAALAGALVFVRRRTA